MSLAFATALTKTSDQKQSPQPRLHHRGMPAMPALCWRPQGVPLPELFQRATAAVEQVESTPWAAPERREQLQQGLHLLRLASKLVDAAGLFSPNEDKDDIATNHLRYLLIPYYLGELLSQADPGEHGKLLGEFGSRPPAHLPPTFVCTISGSPCTSATLPASPSLLRAYELQNAVPASSR